MEARHTKEVEAGLTAIFSDDQGAMPDLKTFGQKRSRWWIYALLGGFVFLSALIVAAWVGFSIFKPFRGFSGQGLAIVIEGPERVSLGQETTYFINYQNRTSEPIASSALRVTFPSDFIIASVEPAQTDPIEPSREGAVPAAGLSWRLGMLPVDGRGTIKIKGTFTGAIGTVTAVQVVGTYRPSSFQSDFDVLSTKVLTYADSVLVGSLVTPAKVLPGDRVTILYRLENHGTEPFNSLHARLTLPEGFQLAATTTANVSGQVADISIGTLEPGASSTVRVTGSFASGASGEAHVIAEAGHPTADGTFLASQKTETSFVVLAGDLSLKLVVNGQDQDMAIQYGSVLRFGIGYENTAPEPLEDVRIRFRLEQVTPTGTRAATLADWSAFIDHTSATRRGDTLTWEADAIPALAKLPSRDPGSIGFTLNAIPVSAGTSSFAVRAILEADVGKVGSTVVNRLVQAAPIILRYSSDVKAAASARYFSEEGAPLGSGPLPPQVGKTTTYRIEWDINKTFHELGNLRLRAVIPSGVAWTGNSGDTAGELSYDNTSRTVTWNLNRMPQDVKEQAIWFDLSVTPTEADADRFAKLLGETRFEATDTVTSDAIVQNLPALTTDLENDEGAQGKGVVRKP